MLLAGHLTRSRSLRREGRLLRSTKSTMSPLRIMRKVPSPHGFAPRNLQGVMGRLRVWVSGGSPMDSAMRRFCPSAVEILAH